MKTPWHSLLQHGTAFAALIVITICGAILLTVVAGAVVLSKILVIIR